MSGLIHGHADYFKSIWGNNTITNNTTTLPRANYSRALAAGPFKVIN
jgi:hypothetical protein